jgi:carbonic anhydrase
MGFICSGSSFAKKRMSILNDILDHNREFVARSEYERFRTDRFPDKKIVVVTCMDTRLIELLPAAMNLRQGDAKILKTAGAVVAHPFGSVMRSIMVAVYELGAAEICVVGHHDCGMTNLSYERILDKAQTRGVSGESITMLRNSGIDLNKWLSGFENVYDAVRSSVGVIRNHPLMPKDVQTHGLVIHPETGKLEVVDDSRG